MTMSDPIADMLTRIRNANTAKHDTVDVPSSKMKLALAQILRRQEREHHLWYQENFQARFTCICRQGRSA